MCSLIELFVSLI